MILVDTSVWIDHMRVPDRDLTQLLKNQKVLMHPYVIGEIAMGSIARRPLVLQQLHKLQVVRIATDAEVFVLVEDNTLFGSGIGYLDAHLLASVWLSGGNAAIWTRDKRLRAAGLKMNLAVKYQ